MNNLRRECAGMQRLGGWGASDDDIPSAAVAPVDTTRTTAVAGTCAPDANTPALAPPTASHSTGTTESAGREAPGPVSPAPDAVGASAEWQQVRSRLL